VAQLVGQLVVHLESVEGAIIVALDVLDVLDVTCAAALEMV
jgi:hypothetical protein